MEVNNLTSFSIDDEMVCSVVKFVLKKESESGSVSVAFVNEEEIRSLNRTYRKKDRSTDVLSFSYLDRDFLGEVIISPRDLLEKKEENGFDKAIVRALIHGVLHILGYDHINKDDGTKMESKEKVYFSFLENKFFKR